MAIGRCPEKNSWNDGKSGKPHKKKNGPATGRRGNVNPIKKGGKITGK
jgi:hypothetical protein